MIHPSRRSLQFIINRAAPLLAAIFITGCAVPIGMGVPVVGLETSPTASLTFTVNKIEGEATPTPFQPIPPTEIYFPTETPLPTAIPSTTPTALPTATSTTTPLPEIEDILDGAEVEGPSKQFNILLLGADKRRRQKHYRTDTIILLTANPDLKRVNILSFPRDLWVNIPGHGSDRINTAFTYGKFPLVKRTFQENFGVKIDHTVLINFKEFKKIVDSLGSLEVNVGQPVADYRAGYYVKVPKGRVSMDADMALWYVRSRKTSNDFARNKRQQEVLSAIFYKLLSMDGLKRAPQLFSFFKTNVTTDIGITNIIRWLPFAIKIIDNGSINQYYIGPEQVYDWITPGGAMVLVPHQNAVMAVIRKAQNR